MRGFSNNPTKTFVELSWLAYFVVWSSVLGFVMVGGFALEWGDAALMTLGVSLFIFTGLSPLFFHSVLACGVLPSRLLPPSLSKVKLADLAQVTAAMMAGVTSLSFGLNWLMTPFFFDVLHMRYGFNVSIRIERNPVFLYFLTVPYFSFYSVLGCVGYRLATKRLNGRSGIAVAAPIAFALAFLETLLMANPLIDNVFCYDDLLLVLTFGSLCYGVGFLFSIWAWIRAVPEDPTMLSSYPFHGYGAFASRQMWVHAAASNAAAAVLTSIVLHYVKLYVAPLVTTVVENSAPVGGCLLKT